MHRFDDNRQTSGAILWLAVGLVMFLALALMAACVWLTVAGW